MAREDFNSAMARESRARYAALSPTQRALVDAARDVLERAAHAYWNRGWSIEHWTAEDLRRASAEARDDALGYAAFRAAADAYQDAWRSGGPPPLSHEHADATGFRWDADRGRWVDTFD